MRIARLVLNIAVFGAAAIGSIWFGWIYAGSQLDAGNPAGVTAPVSTSPHSATAGVPSPGLSQVAEADAIERMPNLAPPPGVSSLDLIPGATTANSNTASLNGFPTISKDAIERAAGYSDRSSPEVELPFKIGPGELNDGGTNP